MKTRIVLMGLAAVLLSGGVFAQTIENDDMYFSAKDRAKLKAAKSSEITASAKPVKRATLVEDETGTLNPTDSYSARNINPEYAARANAQTAQTDNEDYFVNNYQTSTSSDINNWNNNFSSWYGNNWYPSGYYGSSINNSWNSPYYGFNNPYSSPWYNPYWSNAGWSTSFSYYWGSSWNYGWGGNYNYWNQPYCGTVAGGWGPAVGMGMGLGSSGWYGPGTTVVVVNQGEGRHTSYGGRGTRSTNMVAANPRGGNDGRGRTVTTTESSSTSTNMWEPSSNGRTAAATGRTRTEYYNRSWRNTSSDSQSSSGNSWNFDNNNRTYHGNSSFNNDRSSNYSPSRSNSSSFSGGGRSSGGSSSSGSSSGGTRGRTRN